MIVIKNYFGYFTGSNCSSSSDLQIRFAVSFAAYFSIFEPISLPIESIFESPTIV